MERKGENKRKKRKKITKVMKMKRHEKKKREEQGEMIRGWKGRGENERKGEMDT